MNARALRAPRLEQVLRRHEAVIGERQQLCLCGLDFARGHAALRTDVVDAVIDDGGKPGRRKQRCRHRVVRPQQVVTQPEPPAPEHNAEPQQPTIQRTHAAHALQWDHERGPYPQPVPHLTGSREPAREPPQYAAEILPRSRRPAKPERIDVQHAMATPRELYGHVLLVGPERIRPVGSGQQHDVGFRFRPIGTRPKFHASPAGSSAQRKPRKTNTQRKRTAATSHSRRKTTSRVLRCRRRRRTVPRA